MRGILQSPLDEDGGDAIVVQPGTGIKRPRLCASVVTLCFFVIFQYRRVLLYRFPGPLGLFWALGPKTDCYHNIGPLQVIGPLLAFNMSGNLLLSHSRIPKRQNCKNSPQLPHLPTVPLPSNLLPSPGNSPSFSSHFPSLSS